MPPLLTRPLQGNLVPLYERVMADHLTPVLAYRCLVKEDDREAPSFLFESVTNGTQQGRYSFVGAAPALEVVSRGQQVHVMDHRRGTRETMEVADPMQARCGCLPALRCPPALRRTAGLALRCRRLDCSARQLLACTADAAPSNAVRPLCRRFCRCRSTCRRTGARCAPTACPPSSPEAGWATRATTPCATCTRVGGWERVWLAGDRCQGP